METQPQGWRVERRYKDVLKLRSCLTKSFPGYIIPSLPSIIFNGEKEDQVCKEYIELFFKHLVKVPELKGFEIVEKFLELSDRKDFMIYLNRLYKTTKTLEINEMVHKSGIAKINVSSDVITFSKNAATFAKNDRESLDKYFSIDKTLIKRLYELNRDVSQQFEKMTSKLREASLLFRKLSSNAGTISVFLLARSKP